MTVFDHWERSLFPHIPGPPWGKKGWFAPLEELLILRTPSM